MISNEIRVSKNRTLKHVVVNCEERYFCGGKAITVEDVSVPKRYEFFADSPISSGDVLKRTITYYNHRPKESGWCPGQFLRLPEGFIIYQLTCREIREGLIPQDDWAFVGYEYEAIIRFVKSKDLKKR